jgi:multidrug efflux system outer membrane protein
MLTSLIASLTQSIFDGGRLQGQVIQSQARKTGLVEQYMQSVLTSLKEVQDNFGSVASSESRQALLDQAVKEAQEAYRIANVRYKAGSIDLLTMFDSHRTQLQAEGS